MSEPKFKVGDKVKQVSGGTYCIADTNILTISDITENCELDCPDCPTKRSYGFEEDIDSNGEAHWCNVETNFILVEGTLDRLKKQIMG